MKIVNINEEALEAIWTCEEKGVCTHESLKMRVNNGHPIDDALLSELDREGLLTIHKNEVRLTEKGRNEAKPIIRRHRLAERLLTDVLGMSVEETEASACEYEHVLAPGLTEAICTLLGHPKECPHGSPIPEGECCKRLEHSVKTAVRSLDAMNVGNEMKISYIRTNDNTMINKLVTFGISPGTKLTIRQKSPTFVIQIGHAQIALERNIASTIYGLEDK
jgi:DtxR family Mn-dependent transcriptional regulator